jgi:ATP-dependent Lon protease
VTNGLSYSEVGGDLLEIEAVVMPGKGEIKITGKLGDVMKESVLAAISYIRSRSLDWDLEVNFFKEHDIHLHVPEGAIPKDGPSAGITMTIALISAATGKPVRGDIAMTGEITLTGKVLPVGGIKEKALAAMRAGIETIIIPWKNQKDVLEIPAQYRKKLNFIPVKNIQEVLSIALVDWKGQLDLDQHKRKTDEPKKPKDKNGQIAA